MGLGRPRTPESNPAETLDFQGVAEEREPPTNPLCCVFNRLLWPDTEEDQLPIQNSHRWPGYVSMTVGNVVNVASSVLTGV